MITRDTILDYLDDIRAHPENYVTLKSVMDEVLAVRSIKTARTMETLKAAFTKTTRDAKGNPDLLTLLRAAKDERKAQLEAV